MRTPRDVILTVNGFVIHGVIQRFPTRLRLGLFYRFKKKQHCCLSRSWEKLRICGRDESECGVIRLTINILMGEACSCVALSWIDRLSATLPHGCVCVCVYPESSLPLSVASLLFHTHTHTHTHAGTHTCTHTHARTHARTHTHTHSRALAC